MNNKNYDVRLINSSFERVQHFKYLETTLTNRNSIQKENKSKLKSGNACYHSVQNRLASSLLPKNTMIKIHRTIILPVVLYGWETWSLMRRRKCFLFILAWNYNQQALKTSTT